MARGRFISKEISIDKKVNSLSSPWSMLAFTWLLTHADREGRTYGDPIIVRSVVFPRQESISLQDIESYIKEWVEVGLVNWYEVDGEMYIEFPNFDKHQVGLRKDKEPLSTIPQNPLRNNDGKVPEDFRQPSANLPSEEKLREVNVIKREVKENGSNPAAISPVQHMLESLTGIMPSHPDDLKALDEIEALNPLKEDIQSAFEWIRDKGKRIHHYSSLVNPIRVSIAKRVQKPESTLDRSKKAVLQVLEEINNGND